METRSIEKQYEALRSTVGAVWLQRDFIRADGPDSQSFLQGQLTQDVATLDAGASRLTFLLQPRGKVVGLLRVTRLNDNEYLLDIDSGFGTVILQRLARFKLRVKVELSILQWKCLSLRGPQVEATTATNGAIKLDNDWPGSPGVDFVGDDITIPTDVEECSSAAWEAIRIESGTPAMGHELNEDTIPQETGLVAQTVSFTKGCYTGQELVARIDSRGHVNRHLRGLILSNAEVQPGATIATEGPVPKSVGMVTSVAYSPHFDAVVALGFVRREIDPPTEVLIKSDNEESKARVESLPLLS